MDTYVYELGENLYINLTNKCSNACTFCVRNGHEGYFGNKLWLKKEPTAEDVLGAIDFSKKYEQVVFCGFGEPTERADVLVAVAKELKKRGYVIRVNTNGQGNLINGRDITADLAECVDDVNVSLNACDAEKYQKICRSRYGEAAFEELLSFAEKCRDRGIKTNLSIVDVIGEEDVEKCKTLAKARNLPLRVRAYIEDN
ncbi:MAG: radical SAM protein [Bacillota bacterium]|nr:MAG: radical SAM protein [Bacillota bacterium]